MKPSLEEKKQPNLTEKESESTQMWAEDEYRFHGQRADEHVMLVRNQHWVVLLPAVLIVIVSLVIPAAILFFLNGNSMFYLIIVYIVAGLLYLGYHLYGYMNTLCIISNHRILNIIQKGFFSRKISEAELSRIQDVSSDIKGLLQTLFGFGDVTIRTASESVLTLKNIAKPYDVQQALVRMLKEVK